MRSPRHPLLCILFFFNDTATTEIYTLSLHDALPIYVLPRLAVIVRDMDESVVSACPHKVRVERRGRNRIDDAAARALDGDILRRRRIEVRRHAGILARQEIGR